MALILTKRRKQIKKGREGGRKGTRGEGRKGPKEEGFCSYHTLTLYAYRYVENKITVSKSKFIHLVDLVWLSCHQQ